VGGRARLPEPPPNGSAVETRIKPSRAQESSGGEKAVGEDLSSMSDVSAGVKTASVYMNVADCMSGRQTGPEYVNMTPDLVSSSCKSKFLFFFFLFILFIPILYAVREF
jgi:hypothetical protein